MILTRMMHKLREDLHRISQVWASESKINETSHKATISLKVGQQRTLSLSKLVIMFHEKLKWLDTQKTSIR